MEGLDGRHRDKNGQIERKHGNTKMRTLKPGYPELKNFRNDDTLGQVRARYGVESLDGLLEKLRTKRTK
jgi:hypothetical protein